MGGHSISRALLYVFIKGLVNARAQSKRNRSREQAERRQRGLELKRRISHIQIISLCYNIGHNVLTEVLDYVERYRKLKRDEGGTKPRKRNTVGILKCLQSLT